VCSTRSVEQRRAVRFDVQAQVVFSWMDRTGKNQRGVGRTLNISIAGVFVVCSLPPEEGREVDLEIHLPPLTHGALQNLKLETKGTVTRVSGIVQESGFAASSQFELHEILP
jgi:PilZ domain